MQLMVNEIYQVPALSVRTLPAYSKPIANRRNSQPRWVLVLIGEAGDGEVWSFCNFYEKEEKQEVEEKERERGDNRIVPPI